MECSTVLMEEQQNCGSRYVTYEIFNSNSVIFITMVELYESM